MVKPHWTGRCVPSKRGSLLHIYLSFYMQTIRGRRRRCGALLDDSGRCVPSRRGPLLHIYLSFYMNPNPNRLSDSYPARVYLRPY